MRTMHCALDENSPDDITLKWSLFNKHFIVDYKGRTIFEHHRKVWWSTEIPVVLPDGTVLQLILSNAAPQLIRNGVPIPGSPGSTRWKAKEMVPIFIVLAIYHLMVGIITLLFSKTFLGGPFGAISWFVAAVFFMGLAYWANRTLSLAPYIVFLSICCPSAVVLLSSVTNGTFYMVIIQFALIIYSIRSIKAIYKLQRERNVHQRTPVEESQSNIA